MSGADETSLHRLETLRRSARAHLPGHLEPARERAAQARFEARIEARPPRHAWRWVLTSGAVVGAAATLLLLFARPLSYTTVAATRAADGHILAPPEHTASVDFSDGSWVQLAPGARIEVASTSRRGAAVIVHAGRTQIGIEPREHASWTFTAGPYQVLVRGTVFEVDWARDRQELRVNLARGRVIVRGPMTGAGVDMKPGQRLFASVATRTLKVDDGAIDVATPTPEPPETSATPEPRTAPPATRPRPVFEAADWPARLAAGAPADIVAEAERQGRRRVLRARPLADLVALADAARYAGTPDLAEASLLSIRRRFAGTPEAVRAAFMLGRLAEDNRHDLAAALAHYDRYLREAAAGGPAAALVAQALGRKMLVFERLRDRDEACATARRYLELQPAGPYAESARSMCR